jgi:hypothetical protein
VSVRATFFDVAMRHTRRHFMALIFCSWFLCGLGGVVACPDSAPSARSRELRSGFRYLPPRLLPSLAHAFCLLSPAAYGW